MKKVADVARLFKVTEQMIEKWGSVFAQYLGSSARAETQPRLFNETDLRVLALIAYYWEETSDHRNIHFLLKDGYHNDNLYLNFADLRTQIQGVSDHTTKPGEASPG
jgi:hypothetical protein